MRDEEFDVANVEYEEQLEEIRGENKLKPKMSMLNQKKISKWELDSLFLEEDGEEYEEEF